MMIEEKEEQKDSPQLKERGGLRPGGTSGGEGLFLGGIVLVGLGFWFLLDSVRVVSGGYGVFGRMMSGGRAGLETTSMGIIFVPFVIGVAALFFDARKRWAWVLSGLGFILLVIEILSRIQFVMNVKTSHMLLILVMIAAGAGLMAKAYRSETR